MRAREVALSQIRELWYTTLTDGELGVTASRDFAHKWFDEILDVYSSPLRRYHTMARFPGVVMPGHIEHMLLDVLPMVEHIVKRRAHMIFSIMLHDAIYNPTSKTNEADSNTLGKTILLLMGAPRTSINIVSRYIMATRHGLKQRRWFDERLIADMNLYALSLSEDRVLRDARNVRREYACYDDAEFMDGHDRFFTALLSRGFIYQTPFFKQFDSKLYDNIGFIRKNMRRSVVTARPSDKPT